MATWFPFSKWVWFGEQDPRLCLGLLGRCQPRRVSVSATSSSDASPKAPLLCFPSHLSQILLQFSASLAGVLANLISRWSHKLVFTGSLIWRCGPGLGMCFARLCAAPGCKPCPRPSGGFLVWQPEGIFGGVLCVMTASVFPMDGEKPKETPVLRPHGLLKSGARTSPSTSRFGSSQQGEVLAG